MTNDHAGMHAPRPERAAAHAGGGQLTSWPLSIEKLIVPQPASVALRPSARVQFVAETRIVTLQSGVWLNVVHPTGSTSFERSGELEAGRVSEIL